MLIQIYLILEILSHGIVDKQVTSLQKELNKEIDMGNKLKIHLVNLFEMELV